MSGLRQQIDGMIETCETVLEKKGNKDESVEVSTQKIAQAILAQAQAQAPDDKVLATVKLDDLQLSWTSLLAAMQTIRASLPESHVRPAVARRRPFSSRR